MTDFVQQKFDADCAVASLAMLLGVAYERVAQHCQGNMIVRFGLPDFRAVQIAAMFEVELVELDASRIDWSRPAVLTVPSLNAAADTESTGMHAVYWDGTRVWDPNHGRPGKRTWTNQAARRSAIDGMQARPR